jgi:predicted GH43/DUF377 family glycosyl hydrolase
MGLPPRYTDVPRNRAVYEPAVRPPKPEYTSEALREYHSILKQGERVVFIESSGLLEGPYHYNSTLIERPDGLWLAYRDQNEMRQSRIGLCRLTDELQVESNRELILPDYFPDKKREEKEDPRLFWFQNSAWLSYCAWNRSRCCAIAIVKLDEDWLVAGQIKTTWGDNWSSWCFQKNWCFFESQHDPDLHCVYYPSPHEVVAFSQDGSGRFVAREPKMNWAWGLPRGGTPPVLVDDLYFSFFHSRLMTPQKRFRYFMGAYAFESAPPYRPKIVSRKPILAASVEDPNVKTLPIVVFPCGAVFRSGEWWVSLGVNDVKTALLKKSHDELVQAMIPC